MFTVEIDLSNVETNTTNRFDKDTQIVVAHEEIEIIVEKSSFVVLTSNFVQVLTGKEFRDLEQIVQRMETTPHEPLLFVIDFLKANLVSLSNKRLVVVSLHEERYLLVVKDSSIDSYLHSAAVTVHNVDRRFHLLFHSKSRRCRIDRILKASASPCLVFLSLLTGIVRRLVSQFDPIVKIVCDVLKESMTHRWRLFVSPHLQFPIVQVKKMNGVFDIRTGNFLTEESRRKNRTATMKLSSNLKSV